MASFVDGLPRDGYVVLWSFHPSCAGLLKSFAFLLSGRASIDYRVEVILRGFCSKYREKKTI